MWGAKDWLSIPRDEQISTLCGGRENSRANWFRDTQSNKIAQYGLQTWLGIRHILKYLLTENRCAAKMNYLFKYKFSVSSISFSTSFFHPILYPLVYLKISTLKCCHKVPWELWLEAGCSSSPDLSQDVWLCSTWQNVLLDWPPSHRQDEVGHLPISLEGVGEVVLEALPEAAVAAFPGMKKYVPIFWFSAHSFQGREREG